MNLQETKRIKYFTWHPVLLAVFPVLALLGHNIAEIKMAEALRALFISACMAFVLLLVVNLFLRNWHKAAAVVTILLVLFFSYGHIYNLLETRTLAGIFIGRHRILVPLYLLLFGLAIGWVIRSQRDFRLWTQTLNIIALAALAFPLLQISTYSIQAASNPGEYQVTEAQELLIQPGQPAPDIYYIILDAYARDDVLENFYDYDNSSFLNELAGLGFFVARCSQSNYAQTQLSLATSLNMDYIGSLDESYTEDRSDRVGIPGLIKHNAARQLLEQLGYTTVAFETGYYWTQIEDADVYLSPQASVTSLLDITGGLNSFEAMLIKDSAALIVADSASLLPKFIQPDLDYPNKIHRERVLYTLEQLGKLPAMPGPKFVFAHIVSPHKPFVFGPAGEIVEQEKDDIVGYRDQVAYLNSRLIPLFRQMITNSDTPPIIILQADHGGVDTSVEDRLAILNAYYLPGEGNPELYENISPINTFRLVFNRYFGGQYNLLEDTSYFSSYQSPYKYTIIPSSRPGCP